MGKCVHGRQKCRCKYCGGASICVHGRQKRQCKDCGGSGLCVHKRQKSRCKDCGGSGLCVHNRQKRQCKDCGGSGFCVHNRQKSRCKDCGGSGLCVHNRQKSRCKDCGSSGLCVHNRQKRQCKDCGGSGFCVHKRQKSRCKDCGGSGLCVHNRQKSRCKDCGGSGRRHQNDVNSSGHGLPKGPKKRRLGAGDVARDALGRIHVEDGLMRMVCHAHVNSSGQGVPKGPKKRRLGAGDVARDALGRIHVEDGLMRMVCHAHVNSSGQGVPKGPKKMRVGAGAGSKRPAKVNPSGQGLPKLPQGPQTEDGGRPSDSTKGDAATAGIFFDGVRAFREAVHVAMVQMCAPNPVCGPIVKTEPQVENGGISRDENAGRAMVFANRECFLKDLNGRPLARGWGLSEAGKASARVDMINAERDRHGIPGLSHAETLSVLTHPGPARGYDREALKSLVRGRHSGALDEVGKNAKCVLLNYLDATQGIAATQAPRVPVKRERSTSPEVKQEQHVSPKEAVKWVAVKREQTEPIARPRA